MMREPLGIRDPKRVSSGLLQPSLPRHPREPAGAFVIVLTRLFTWSTTPRPTELLVCHWLDMRTGRHLQERTTNALDDADSTLTARLRFQTLHRFSQLLKWSHRSRVKRLERASSGHPPDDVTRAASTVRVTSNSAVCSPCCSVVRT